MLREPVVAASPLAGASALHPSQSGPLGEKVEADGDCGETGSTSNVNLRNAMLLQEAAEIENRLRTHCLELVEPSIQRTRQLEVKLKDTKTMLDTVITEVGALRKSTEGQESLRGCVEGFRAELAEWDRERREHEQQVSDRASLQDIEINDLRKGLERKTADITASNRVLKSLGDNVAEVREEIGELRRYCNERLDLTRDKLAKLRDEFETREMAVETEQHRLRDSQTSLDTIVVSVKSELRTIARDTAEANLAIEELNKTKVSVTCVEQQQQEFSEFTRRLDAHVSGLGQQFGNLVDDVKGHFQTAADVVGTSTAKQMEVMREKYKEEVHRVDTVLQELDAFLAQQKALEANLRQTITQVADTSEKERQALRETMQGQLKKRELESMELGIEVKQMRRSLREVETAGHSSKGGGGPTIGKDVLSMIVESNLLGATLELQDDQDRKSIALFGFKPGAAEGGSGKSCTLPELDGGRHSARGGPKFQAAAATPRRRLKDSGGGDAAGGFGMGGEASGPVVTLDKRCLACSGSQATVLAGFKLACLQYAPSPVEYQKVTYSRSELIRLRIDLLNQVREQLRSAAD